MPRLDAYNIASAPFVLVCTVIRLYQASNSETCRVHVTADTKVRRDRSVVSRSDCYCCPTCILAFAQLGRSNQPGQKLHLAVLRLLSS